MHPKTQTLTLAIVAVVAIGSSASAGYKWVAYRKTDCAGADIGGLVCDTTILAQPNPAVCNSDAVNMVAVCDDQVPPFPLPAGCHFFQCPYRVDLSKCLGPTAASNGPVFVCKRR
jgi:hypothetical protein